ncbi:MAG TPA: ABC transporter ATP-binding protein [Gemmatimonadaceae bacterium]|nr:ABC transporter ATP-binding protein [Gemmatimonadaceae bacterium]
MADTRARTSSSPATFLSAMALGARSMWRRPMLSLVFLAATLLQGAVQGLLIWALRDVLEAFGTAGGVTMHALVVGAAVIFAIWLLRSLSAFAALTLSMHLSHWVEVEAMLQVLAKLLALSVRFFDKNSRGDVVMTAYHDLKGIRAVTLEVGRAVLYLSQLAGLAVAAWVMSPKLALLGLVLVPLGALPAYWFGQDITHGARGERKAVTTLHDSFFQVASGIRMIKVSRGQPRVLAAAQHVGHDLHRALMRQAKSSGFARFLMEAVAGLGLVLVLTVGGRDVARGAMSWQSLLGLLVAMMAVYTPVVGLLQLFTRIRSIIPNLDRVDAIVNEPIEIVDRPHARPISGAPAIIELRDVSFVYEDRPVLSALSAVFYRGETIGIVGASGAGKSTLLSLLMRFYDVTSGGIYFDGVDVRDIRHDDLMDLCAIVMQEPFLFADTVANNIRMGRPDAAMEDVIGAARAANIHQEILAMEHGYDTMLGVGRAARGVSGGQKQRICIAAALLKNAPILFLDEATSSLDSLSEQKVQAAIDRLMQGRTTFVVAHRLSTLRDADRLLVLDQGRLVGLGRHDELMTRCPTYRTLWRFQNQPFDTGDVLGAGQPEVVDA